MVQDKQGSDDPLFTEFVILVPILQVFHQKFPQKFPLEEGGFDPIKAYACVIPDSK